MPASYWMQDAYIVIYFCKGRAWAGTIGDARGHLQQRFRRPRSPLEIIREFLHL